MEYDLENYKQNIPYALLDMEWSGMWILPRLKVEMWCDTQIT